MSISSSDKDAPEQLKLSDNEGAVLKIGRQHAIDDHVLLTPTSDGRFPHVDATRIACVWCVAIDHGASAFGVANALFTQNWVLQYLYLVCGVSFGLSSRATSSYVARLGLYLIVGVLCNASAYVLTGQDCLAHMFSVVFQFWFVAALMLYALMLSPLKAHMANVKAEIQKVSQALDNNEADNPEVTAVPDQRLGTWLLIQASLVIVIGLLIISVIFFLVAEPISSALASPVAKLPWGKSAIAWGAPTTFQAAHDYVYQCLSYIQLTLTSLFVVLVYPRVSGETSLVGWLLLAITYSHRIVFFRAQQERPFHCFDLMMLGLVCYFYGLRNRKGVAELLARYWMLVLFACTLLWPPGEYGEQRQRFDEFPVDSLDERARWNALEGIFVTIWLVAGERLVDPKIFTEDRLDFLNEWSLIIFLLHKAVHMTIMAPLNWVFLVGLAPLCHYMLKSS